MGWLNRALGSESPKLARPVRAAAGRLLQRTGRSDRLIIRRPGYALPFYPTSNVALTYWVVPGLVDPTEQAVVALLAEGEVFVDVGANIGTVTAAAAGAVGPTGAVLAVEPHPVTAASLRRTVAVNGLRQVACLEVACSDAPGVADLTDEPRRDDTNRLDPSPSTSGPTGGSRGATVAVEVTTLAEVLRGQRFDRVDLVKIDVEGHEVEVLRGLSGWKGQVGMLYVELIEAVLRRRGSSPEAVRAELGRQGYRCFGIDGDPTNVLAVRDDPGEIHRARRRLGGRLVHGPDDPDDGVSGSR